MKSKIYALLLGLFCYTSLTAQVIGTKSSQLSYSPSNGRDGCIADIGLIYKFGKYLGMETVFFAYTSQKITGYIYNGVNYPINTVLTINGQSYNPSDVGIDSWEGNGSFTIKANLFAPFITDVSIEGRIHNKFVNKAQHDANTPIAHLEDYTTIDKYDGVKGSNLMNFDLRNIEVIRCDCGKKEMAIRKFIRNKVGYTDAFNRGRAAFDEASYPMALSYFKEGQTFEKTSEIQLWIKKCEDALKEKEEEKEEEIAEKEEPKEPEKVTTTANTVNDDDFWNGKNDNSSKTTTTSSDDDFWNGKNDNSSKTTTTSSDDDFWNRLDDSQKDNKEQGETNGYQIVRANGLSGVLASNGDLLIPFRDWEIVSYRDGIAKVRLNISSETRDLCPSCGELECAKVYSIILFEEGYVDNRGEWLRAADKKYTLDGKEPFYLVSRRSDMSYEEEKRSDARREARSERCKEMVEPKLDQLKAELESKGYELKK